MWLTAYLALLTSSSVGCLMPMCLVSTCVCCSLNPTVAAAAAGKSPTDNKEVQPTLFSLRCLANLPALFLVAGLIAVFGDVLFVSNNSIFLAQVKLEDDKKENSNTVVLSEDDDLWCKYR